MGLLDAFRKRLMFPPTPPKPTELPPDFDLRPAGKDPDTGALVPYAPFDKSIPPSDIAAINAQQDRRNLMFAAWVAKVAEGCAILGEKMDYDVEQLPENWFVQPSFASLQISGGNLDFVNHLHMDSWTPRVAVHTLIGRSR